MKNLLLIISLLVPFVGLGASDKDFKKLITNLDVSDEAKMVAPNDSHLFWKITIDTNPSLAKFVKGLNKKGSIEKAAAENAKKLPGFNDINKNMIVDSLQNFCDSLLETTGMAQQGLNCKLYILDSNEINKFTVLTDDGFAICLTSSLINMNGVSQEILTGYVANEFCHGAFMHNARSLYPALKKQVEKEMMKGMIFGMTLGVTGTLMHQASLEKKAREQHIKDSLAALEPIGEFKTMKFAPEYLKEQVYEADLTAFRYLQTRGIENNYINGLKLLSAPLDTLYKERKDYLPVSARIEFLEFVKNNPELGASANKARKKKK